MSEQDELTGMQQDIVAEKILSGEIMTCLGPAERAALNSYCRAWIRVAEKTHRGLIRANMRIQRLEAENKRLKEALEYVARKTDPVNATVELQECVAVARKALSAKEGLE